MTLIALFTPEFVINMTNISHLQKYAAERLNRAKVSKAIINECLPIEKACFDIIRNFVYT